MKSVVSAPSAPAAIGPYSQGIGTGNLYFFSGTLAIDPETGNLVGSTAREQTEQILKNMRALLDSVGLDPSSVVKTTVFLTDLSEFGTVNEVYAGMFSAEAPARSCVEVSRLPKNALVEIEFIATK